MKNLRRFSTFLWPVVGLIVGAALTMNHARGSSRGVSNNCHIETGRTYFNLLQCFPNQVVISLSTFGGGTHVDCAELEIVCDQ